MTTTEDTAAQDAAKAAAEAAEKVIAGAAAQLGPDRIRGLRLMAQARTLQDAAAIFMVHADIAEAAGNAHEALMQAQHAREEAEDALRPPRETVERLQAELLDCQGRASNIDTVISDDMDLTARVEARSLRLAFEEEAADLRGRIDLITRQIMAPLQQALTEARGGEERAKATAADLIGAEEDPLSHPRARQTAGHQLWMSNRWSEVLATGDQRTPGWSQAKGHLMTLLRASGIGAEIEQRAIQAYRGGDPSALAVGGNTTHLPSGDTVIFDPSTGAPPVVYSGRATRPQLATASPAPPVDTTPASTLMAQTWGQIQHQTSPGLYVHP